MAIRNLSNVRTSSGTINTEQMKGARTDIAFLQFTSAGLKHLQDNTLPTGKGMVLWGQINEASCDLLGVDFPADGIPALMLKGFDDAKNGKFSDATFSMFFTVLETEEDYPQVGVGSFKHVEDNRSEFRGNSRTGYDQLELCEDNVPTVDKDGEPVLGEDGKPVMEVWLKLVAITK